MPQYIALLRGINVSGYNKIKMADLKNIFINGGFNNFQSYIQSGNIIFSTKSTSSEKIEKQISKMILKEFNHTVEVFVMQRDYLINVFNSNPFIKTTPDIDISKLCVTFLKETPNFEGSESIKQVKKSPLDLYEISNKAIYLFCPNGFGRTKLTNNLFEKKLNTIATTRNWKTITKLIELSS